MEIKLINKEKNEIEICKWCNNLFKPNHANRKYCSQLCYRKMNNSKKYYIKYRKNNQWSLTFWAIKSRCDNPKHDKYKFYGGKGIKCLITKEELKYLWFRDKAYLLKKSSIDRIDNNGHYILNNCRYIELIENIKKDKQLLKDLK